jgi:hypothetical protein
MKDKFKRINILVREEQYLKVQESGLNFSGLVRDLLHDRFSHKKIVLSVEPETRELYDTAISNFGATDHDLEQFFVEALDRLLEEKERAIGVLRKELKSKSFPPKARE